LTWINRVGALKDAPAKPCAATRMLWRGSHIADRRRYGGRNSKKAGESPAFSLQSACA
jgi:hypothetical protein